MEDTKNNTISLEELLYTDFSKLKDIVQKWTLIERTPASGMAYYDPHLDISAVIYHKKIRVFFNRKFEGKKPASFSQNTTIKDI